MDTPKSKLKSLLMVATGNMLYALTVKLFLTPANLVMGGTTGLALTVSHFWNIPIPLFVLIFNLLMLAFGWAVLGRTFALTTIASSLLYPFFLEFWDLLLSDFVLTTDLLLCTLFTGLGIGIALGIVLRAGASTGGMDIPPLVLNKFFRFPVSVSMYAFDFLILLLQALFQPTENVLYGILLALLYTMTLDKVLVMGESRIELKIVSQQSAEITDTILKKIDRGVTLLHGEGGYLHRDTDIVLSVISGRELSRVQKLIREIDPTCFMVVSRVTEVSGRGFSMKKDYR